MFKEFEVNDIVENATAEEKFRMDAVVSTHFLCKHLEEKIYINDLVNKAAMIDQAIKDIPLQWANVVYKFLYKEPYSFWDKEVSECTFRGIEKIHISNLEACSEEMYEALRNFMIAYFTYEELIKVIDNLEPINENPQIKTRMYRIPTYINIVEGCLSNLFKAIRDLLSVTTEKDLKSQTKLQGLCSVMESNGYECLTRNIDIDIRNAINHGGVLLSENEISFFYMKGNTQQKKSMRYYDFDDLIENAFDSLSGIIVGFLRFFIIYPKSLLVFYSRIEERNDFFLKTSLARLIFSFPGTKCEFISTYIEEQINLDIVTDIIETNKLIFALFELGFICREWFPNYKQYFIAFKGERRLSGWARFSNEELEECKNPDKIIPVIEKALSEASIFVADASDEVIDMDTVRYHRFPLINKNGWKIRDIEDCSLPGIKRLRACLYLGDNIRGRRSIIKAVEEAIEEIRILSNPPQAVIKVKHGSMPADVVFLNAYYRQNRRKNRQLYPSNENFVLVAEYCASGVTPINHGLPTGLLGRLTRQKIGAIQYSWNPSSYQSKISK